MRVLILCGLFIDRNPDTAVFIKRRLMIQKELIKEMDALAVNDIDSYMLRFLKNLFNRSSSPDEAASQNRTNDAPFIHFLDSRRTMLHRVFPVLNEKRITSVLRKHLQEKPDIIHAYWVYPHGYIAVKLGQLLGVPVIVSARGTDIHTHPLKHSHIMKRTLFTLESSARAVFVSEDLLKKAMSYGFSGRNSVVIPNGVDTSLFAIRNKSKSKEEKGLNPGLPCVGFVGNLVTVKRAESLPTIFGAVKDRIDSQFIIVGDGLLRTDLEKAFARRDLDVRFAGQVTPNSIPEYMSALDVLVLPSRNEGWPNVAMEALSCGVPVVGSNNGGIPEVIGDCGIVVEEGPEFEERFAEAILCEIQEPVPANKCRRRASNYELSLSVTKEIELYKEVFEEASANR